MCGITGIYKFDKSEISKKIIFDMNETLSHRGPDGGSIWIDKRIGLGHKLLKIQDLSDDSIQPFSYKNLVLTFNGEIYNFQELSDELKKNGYVFETSSDTEVVIKAFDFWGVNCIHNFFGSFAFAVYNKETEDLYLIRDRYGIKPLYYFESKQKEISFASEIKAILKNPEVKTGFNYDMLGVALSCNLWLSPNSSYFNHIKLLEAGTYLKCNKSGVEKNNYYSIKNLPNNKFEKEVIEEFKILINNSVKDKLISQVPVAAFLSGGIDSSLVCKLAKQNYKEILSTYTIHYTLKEDDYLFAKKMIEEEKFKGHNIWVSPSDYSIENIDKVIYHMEEVPVDKVYIPMYLNYGAAKKDKFKVILSGQGSDEPWMGYIFTWDIFKQLGDKFSLKFLTDSFYCGENMILISKLKPDFLQKAKKAVGLHLKDNLFKSSSEDQLNDYSVFATKTIMHNLLLQEDKLGMSHSIECRVPFVDDHRIMELALSTPSSIKIKDGREKYVIREASRDSLPREIVDRSKNPFSEPHGRLYEEFINSICLSNWAYISESKILNNILKDGSMKKMDDFSSIELWWLLCIWRFEKIFNIF